MSALTLPPPPARRTAPASSDFDSELDAIMNEAETKSRNRIFSERATFDLPTPTRLSAARQVAQAVQQQQQQPQPAPVAAHPVAAPAPAPTPVAVPEPGFVPKADPRLVKVPHSPRFLGRHGSLIVGHGGEKAACSRLR